jgi:hypothetical protein
VLGRQVVVIAVKASPRRPEQFGERVQFGEGHVADQV